MAKNVKLLDIVNDSPNYVIDVVDKLWSIVADIPRPIQIVGGAAVVGLVLENAGYITLPFQFKNLEIFRKAGSGTGKIPVLEPFYLYWTYEPCRQLDGS